jgi:hypothetical protein
MSPTFDDWHDSTLLNGRRPLKTICVDATEQLALEAHLVEAIGGFVIV